VREIVKSAAKAMKNRKPKHVASFKHVSHISKTHILKALQHFMGDKRQAAVI